MKISIRLLSDLCCYSGEVYNTTVDTDVVYDDYGLPYIPAKRLKGCIREAALELYEMGLMPHYNAIFGKEGSDASAFTISNARIKNYNAIVNGLNKFEDADFVNQQKVLSLYTYLRTQTAVDSKTGTAIENSLRTLRVLKKGLIFNANVDLENSEYFEEFKNAVSMVKHMGVSRTRGLGLVELKVENSLSTPIDHVLFKENELKDENKISYTIHLNSPLICKSAQGNQAKTEDYIAGSKVLGLIARSMGNDAYQKVMNDIVVSNAYVSSGGQRSLPGRNSLQKIKNQSYVDGKMEIVDMMYFKNDNDKEQRTPANIDYMSEKMKYYLLKNRFHIITNALVTNRLVVLRVLLDNFINWLVFVKHKLLRDLSTQIVKRLNKSWIPFQNLGKCEWVMEEIANLDRLILL